MKDLVCWITIRDPLVTRLENLQSVLVLGFEVRIFLAAISNPVLTARFGHVVSGYKGGCNNHKSGLVQRNPPASVPLALAGEGVSLPVAPIPIVRIYPHVPIVRV